jgi:hypothetical protein
MAAIHMYVLLHIHRQQQHRLVYKQINLNGPFLMQVLNTKVTGKVLQQDIK